MKVLVTGGAGFIGSHLVDKLMEEGYEVRVLDNLSEGKIENISKWIGNRSFLFIKGDLRNPETVTRALEGCEIVYHLAANSDIRKAEQDTRIDFENNIVATYNLLEGMRRNKCSKLIFTSSSTIYGEAEKIPTPETYGPLLPISLYGASKLACEALISAYCNSFNMKSIILRLANVVGSRMGHGVILDFINKLEKNSRRLEVLGDGTQAKSYLHVDDCIDAIVKAGRAVNSMGEAVRVYNVGSEDQVGVLDIARIVIEHLGLNGVEVVITGGVEDGRGWVGDIKNMMLDVGRAREIGWSPRLNSWEAVKRAVEELTGCKPHA